MTEVLKFFFSFALWLMVARVAGLLFILYAFGFSFFYVLDWMDYWPNWVRLSVGLSIIIPCCVYYVVWQWREWRESLVSAPEKGVAGD